MCVFSAVTNSGQLKFSTFHIAILNHPFHTLKTDIGSWSMQAAGLWYREPQSQQANIQPRWNSATCSYAFSLLIRGIKTLSHQLTMSKYILIRVPYWTTLLKNHSIGIANAAYFSWMSWKAKHLLITPVSFYNINFKCVVTCLLRAKNLMSRKF